MSRSHFFRISPSRAAIPIILLASLLPFAAAQAETNEDTMPAAESSPYPGTPFHQLPAELQQQFRTLAESELCPCEGSVESLDECLRDADSCAVAKSGAFAAMQALYRGRSVEQARQALSEQVAAYQTVHEFPVIPEQSRGPLDAKVTVIEFADFECPFCKRLTAVLHQLLDDSPEAFRLQFMHFPLSHHRNGEEAALATIAAAKQGQFWAFHDALFARQTELQAAIDPLGMFREIAQKLGLDLEKFEQDFRAQSSYRAVREQKNLGSATGMTGTPTLFINGRIYVGELDAPSLKRAIEQADATE